MPITVAIMVIAVAIRAQPGASSTKNTGTPSKAEIAREAMTVSSPPRLPRQDGTTAPIVTTPSAAPPRTMPTGGPGSIPSPTKPMRSSRPSRAQITRPVTAAPEHLALGLLSEPDALAAKAIAAQGVALKTLRRRVASNLPPASEQVPDLIPFDLRARKALELTFREALRLGHNYVGTEHILLALLELEQGAGVLTGLGLDKKITEDYVSAAVASMITTKQQADD
jgi:hypothetical protein